MVISYPSSANEGKNIPRVRQHAISELITIEDLINIAYYLFLQM
jgi:hypothetical protein